MTGASLQSLIISGNPPQEILQAHFSEMLIEYHDCIGGDSNVIYVGLLKQKIRLESRRAQLIPQFNFYLRTKSEVIKKLMAKNGFFFEKDTPDNVLIKRFEGFIKNIDINIANKETDLADFEDENNTGEKATEETYLRNIIEMAKHGYKVDINHDSAKYYAITFKAFNQYAKLLKPAA